MRSLMNPRWLLIINTIPVLILAAIYFGAFQVIHTLLEPESIQTWVIFAVGLFFLWGMTLVYALLAIIKERDIHTLYGLMSLLFHVPFLFLFVFHFDDIIPWSIPAWMLPQNMVLYVGSFLMPTLAHALLTLVVGLTPSREGGYLSLKNFGAACLIPLLWYFFMEIIFRNWGPMRSDFAQYTMILLMIASVVLFLFFLIRGIYILAHKRGGIFKKYQLLWKIPIGIIFPLMGLALNNGLFNGFSWSGDFDGIFGDFNHPWFYALAVINGIALCIPRPQKAFHRLLLFALQSITFSYTLYFFLVFIPFLPGSLIALVAFGLGFLMLTPVVLMVFHSIDLASDFRFLQNHYSKKMLLPIFAFGAASIPLALGINYTQDRFALQNALEYVYQSDFDKPAPNEISIPSLNRVIKTIRAHKDDRWRNSLSIGQTPFLSPFYSWLVLDNLTLSEKKINVLERVFFGLHQNTQGFSRFRMPANDDVDISKVNTQSTYDEKEQSWKTWVDLDITNHSSRQKEYVTEFDLPEGAWISDYYLWIEGEKVPGILAEKKSATWVYQQIVSARRDPGILYYLRGNTIAFRVFPFAANQTRRTGFEILHKEPLVFEMDGQKIMLGDPAKEIPILSEAIFSADQKVVYLPEALKNTLPEVERNAYFHFIVDGSEGKDSLLDFYTQTIEELLAENPAQAAQAQLTFTNAYCQDISMNGNWKEELKAQKFFGGFNQERAIKGILVKAGAKVSPQIPEIISLSDRTRNAILPEDFEDFTRACPDINHYQCINADQEPFTFSLQDYPGSLFTDSIAALAPKILAWPNATNPQAYVSGKPGPSVVLLDPLAIDTKDLPKAKNWADALTLEGRYQSYIRYPGQKDEEWLPMVKNSLSGNILTPVMSFISLENEAQRTALKKKQEQVLKGNEALDISEDAHRMSEPSFLFCMILLGFVLFVTRKNRMLGFVK